MSRLLELVATCITAANKAGSIIREIHTSGDLKLVNKSCSGRKDYQTEADRKAQILITTILNSKFKNLEICGEEEIEKEERLKYQKEMNFDFVPDEEPLKYACPSELAQVDISDMIVWIDPLDGTNSFAEGKTEHVAVMIGIALKSGEPIAGVVNQPFYNSGDGKPNSSRTLWGIVGLGVFGMTNKRETKPPGFVVITTTILEGNQEHLECCKAMKPDTIIHTNGCAYKLIKILEEEADLMVFAKRGPKRWDTCACDALLRAVGGTLTGIDGECYNYGKRENQVNEMGIMATLRDHDKYISIVPKNVLYTLLERKSKK